jgi:hypothetical protein
VLLSDSTGRHIWSDHGLRTKECLDFLLGLSRRGIVVGFGLSYDTCHWLADLPPVSFKDRWKDGSKHGLFGPWHDARWPDPSNGPYRIRWIPKRFVEIWRAEPDGKKTYVRIEDVISNLEGGFEQVVRDWLGFEAASPNLSWGKAQRSHFSLEDKERIIAYNSEENTLLVDVMRRFQEARKECGFRSPRFYSPAVLAREMMRRHHAELYVKAPRPTEVTAGELFAMFGARIELGQIGLTRPDQKVYEFDRNAAYPYEIARLPNFANGRWEHEAKIRPNSRWSLYKVFWDFHPEKLLFFPLPFHTPEGSVRFPFAATGWAWAPEVEVALEAARIGKGTVGIIDGWHFVPNDPNEHPFAWIEELFNERARRKDLPAGTAAHAAEYPLKLAMNAMFGIMAQSIAFDPIKGPPFKDFGLAGLITTGTRAALYRIALRNMPSVISFNTDALFSTDPDLLRPAELGKALGQFKRSVFEEGVFAMSGVYRLLKGTLRDGSPDYEVRARGVGERALPFERIIEGWQRHEIEVRYLLPKPRFVGTRLALARNRFASRFGWVVNERKLNLLRPSGKRAQLPLGSDPSLGLVPTLPDYVGFSNEVESSPYRPKMERDAEESVNSELYIEDEVAEPPRTPASVAAETPPRLEREQHAPQLRLLASRRLAVA